MALDFFCEANHGQHSEAVLFVHSLFHTGKQWKNVSDILNVSVVLGWQKAQYYILNPTIQPSDYDDIDNMIFRLAELIRTSTKKGTAHVVGVSVGAHIALKLAHTYPEVASSLFLSGFVVLSRVTRHLVSRCIYIYSNLRRRRRLPFSFRQSRSVGQLFKLPKHPEKFRKRTMIVASDHDRLEDAQALEGILSGWSKVEVRVAPGEEHLWNLCNSKRFARVVSFWTQNSELPDELGMIKVVSDEDPEKVGIISMEYTADSESEEYEFSKE